MKFPIPLFTFCILSSASAQLPASYQLPHDWLLGGPVKAATVSVDPAAGTITLGNGLVERVISTRLGTTIAYNNLMTGQAIIRAVEQEGSITLDGVDYSIGGVTGQTNKAFIDAAALASLKPAPNALRLIGHEIGKPRERLKWNQVRRHAPGSVWPPKGAYLRLDYQMPDPAADTGDGFTAESELGRTRLFVDEFARMDDGWKIRTSPLSDRSSFQNEGKPGEIYTLPDTAVVAERPLPDGTRLVEAEIHPGTDNSSSWGPGIAMVFEKKTLKFNIRPSGLSGVNRPVLGFFDGDAEVPNVSGEEKIDISQAWTLRMRIAGDEVHCEARPANGKWKRYHSMKLPGDFGEPKAFRVGKLDVRGGSSDRDADDELVRLRISRVAFYSAFDGRSIRKPAASASSRSGPLVSVHYEIYDGIPVLSKWITVSNRGEASINLDRFNAETLSVVERSSPVEHRKQRSQETPDALHVETDMSMGGLSLENSDIFTVHWHTDPSYKSQVNYALQTLCLLKVEPARGPDQTIDPGKTFESFRVFELAQDSTDRERRGLSVRRMYRVIAPWVTENPIMLHCASTDEATVRKAIDQAVDTGFEMVILSFGSGFNMESTDPAYFAKWKGINDYAKSRKIELGSYSLYSSRRIGGGNDIVPPPGEGSAHGVCPAVTSPWGQEYLKKLNNALEQTGFTVFEHDGPYPGDEDTTARPPLQKGLNDSRWVHWRTWSDFYKNQRGRGVFMNLPDYYYLNGSNKCSMGYREVNWSLPRGQQRIHTRQNIYDGTWLKTPSMGWMFVPLVQYHGGGAAATIEPLAEHLDHYEVMLRSNLGLGVQACYRGTRIYDTDETRTMVKGVVDWYKKHRDILESDLIHGRRADGLDLDWMLHVNPGLEDKGLLSIYNPTDKAITKNISVPLYYTGITGKARVSANGGVAREIAVDSNHRARLEVTVPANGFSYHVFR